ncbi:MAG: XrtA system polysaccharide chain length determinant [Burkholderiales bacterium]
MDTLPYQWIAHLRGMWNRRMIGLAVAWFVAVIAVATAFAVPERYEASARVQVDTQSLLKPILAGLSIQPNLDQQVALISRTLLNRGNIEKLIGMAGLESPGAPAAGREELIDRLSRTIQINGNATTNLYVITYRDTNPQRAERVVASLLEIFFESSTDDKRQDSISALRFLDEEIKRYEQSLQLAENRLKDFRLKYLGLPGQGGPAAGGDYFARVSKLSDDITNARLELNAASQSRDAYKRELAAQTSMLAATRGPGPAASVPEIDARIAAQRAKLDELLRSFTDAHPDVMGTRRVIAELEAQRAQELAARQRTAAAGTQTLPEPTDRFSAIQQIRVSLADAEAKVASAQSKLASYEGQYAQLTASGRLIPQAEAELAQLNRDYDIQKKTYTDLLARREATLMGANAQETIGQQIRVVDPARVNPRPLQPSRLTLVFLAIAGALAAGVVASLVANQVRPTFHSGSELVAAANRPLLGWLSMVDTPEVMRRKRRSLIVFAGGVGALLTAFAGLLAMMLVFARAG